MPNKLTSVPNQAFVNCQSLADVTLPVGLKSIGVSAFNGCGSLNTIQLPQGLTSIEDYAFCACDGLTSLTIPSTVMSLGSSILSNSDGITAINLLPLMPPTISSSTFSGAPANMAINVLCGNKEFYLEDNYWKSQQNRMYEIPAAVLSVKASDNRMGEVIVVAPNTCTSDEATIQAIPREGCEFVAWNDGNTENPRVVTVTEDVTYTATFGAISTYQLTVKCDAKQGHVAGAGAYYPGEEAVLEVTAFAGYRFWKWADGVTDNPRSVVMDQDTTLEVLFVVGDFCGDNILYTFTNDTLALKGTGEMWNQSAYGWNVYADEVEAISLSEGITSLGTNAFMDLMFVTDVTIPRSVKTIHKRAFENCRSLTSVEFAQNSQLKTIDHWAFYECINLQTMDIPEGVTTIGNGAFYGCAYLESLVLPSSLESIADNGFALCAKLGEITVHATEPPVVDSKTFENVSRSIPVHVPYGMGPKYRAAAVWQEFDIRDKADVVTSVDNMEAESMSVEKVIRNGQVMIVRDGKMYNMLGQEMK